MKVKFPEGVSSASVDGVSYEADAEGFCADVAPEHAAELAAFGIVAVADDEEHEPSSKLHKLINETVKEIADVIPELSDAELEELAALEKAHDDRAGVAKAIEAEQHKRAGNQ